MVVVTKKRTCSCKSLISCKNRAFSDLSSCSCLAHRSLSARSSSNSAFSTTPIPDSGLGGGVSLDNCRPARPLAPNAAFGGGGAGSSSGVNSLGGGAARLGDARAPPVLAPGFFCSLRPAAFGAILLPGIERGGLVASCAYWDGGGAFFAGFAPGLATFLAGAFVAAGGGGGGATGLGFSLALTSAVSKNSLILAFRMSSIPSRKGFICRSPRIFMSVPMASAAQSRTGPLVSPSILEQVSAMFLDSGFEGKSRVVRRHRIKNRRVSSLTLGFLCFRYSTISSTVSVREVYKSSSVLNELFRPRGCCIPLQKQRPKLSLERLSHPAFSLSTFPGSVIKQCLYISRILSSTHSPTTPRSLRLL